MATESEERSFRSNLRKDGSARERRRVFDRDDVIGTSNGKYSHSTQEKPESAISVRSSNTPVTIRIHGMNINDDCHDNGNGHAREEISKNSSVVNRIIDKSYMNDDNEAEDEGEKKEEEEQVKRKVKKSSSGHKRKERKNLREKRRSTGVVIMPGQPVSAGDDAGRQVQENTRKNMGEESAAAAGVTSADVKQSEQYIEELRDELAKAHRELDKLRSDNLRLKDENGALLRVVGSLTGQSPK